MIEYSKVQFYLVSQTDESSVADCIQMSVSHKISLQNLLSICSSKLKVDVQNLYNSSQNCRVFSINDIAADDIVLASEKLFFTMPDEERVS